MKKYNQSSPRNNSDRPQGRSSGRSTPRSEGRPFGDRPRADSRSAPRSEGRPFGDRPRADSRSGLRSEGRPFGDRPRADSRSTPRSEGRPFGDRPRADSRSAPRSEGRPFGDRPPSDSRSAPRSEGRPFGDRPRSDSRSAPRSEGGRPSSDRPRSDSRSAPRSEGRPFGDRPNFSDRPRSPRPEGSKPSFFDRPGQSTRPRGTPHERPEGSRSEGRPFGDRPRSDRPRSDSRSLPRSDSRPAPRTERHIPSSDRPKPKSAKPFADRPRSDSKPDTAAKPFVVYRKNPNDPQEVKYYGFHACLNLWKSRPDDVIRVYVDEKCVKEVAPLLKWCASKAKAYHVVSEEEMAKVSDSVHHEGLCILAIEPKDTSFTEMLEELNKTSESSCLMYLDGVQNPHNIGSIMRVCAHFGIKYILSESSVLPKVTPSAYRVAQGGAEHVKLIAIDDIKSSFKELEKAGFKTVASSSHGGKTLYDYKFEPRMVIVMGSESDGVNDVLLKTAQDTLMIPGTGAVESLNVSVATGLILGEYFRQVKSS